MLSNSTLTKVARIKETKTSRVIQVMRPNQPEVFWCRYYVPKTCRIRVGDFVIFHDKRKAPKWCHNPEGNIIHFRDNLADLPLVAHEMNGYNSLDVDIKLYGVKNTKDIFGSEIPAPFVWVFPWKSTIGELPSKSFSVQERRRYAAQGYRYAMYPMQKWENCLPFIHYPK